MRKIAAPLFVLALMMAMSCADIPPRITSPPMAPIDTNQSFFVEAERQKDAVEKALKKENLKTTSNAFDAYYLLRVRVGTGLRTLDCGHVNNVTYEVLHKGIEVMGMKGRGPTRGCEPNIFDQMTQAIVAQRKQ